MPPHQEDFNLTFAGSGAGTMYGKGLYFSESLLQKTVSVANSAMSNCGFEPFIKESSIVGVYLFCCWADPIYAPFSPRKAAPKLMSIAKMSQVDTITV